MAVAKYDFEGVEFVFHIKHIMLDSIIYNYMDMVRNNLLVAAVVVAAVAVATVAK